LQSLRQTYPTIEIQGLFGPYCEKLGYKPLLPQKRIAVNGIYDVMTHFFIWIKLYRLTFKSLKAQSFSMILLVDFPGFNKILLNYGKKNRLPVYYIAPPQIWPYKHKNIEIFKQVHLQTLFEIDKKPYINIGAHVSCGHFFSSPNPAQPIKSNLIALFPGSRLQLIKRNLPEMLNLIVQSPYLQNNFTEKIIYVPKELQNETQTFLNFYGPTLSGINIKTNFETWPVRPGLAIASPGTITLELALQEVPTFVFAVVNPLTYFFGKRLLKTPWMALPSGLLNQKIFPEWIGTHSQIRKKEFESDLLKTAQISVPLKKLSQMMGSPEGIKVAVHNILGLLNPGLPPNQGQSIEIHKHRSPNHLKFN